MNNKEKYKNSINKIEVDTNVLNSVIEKSRAYKKRSNDIMEKKTKFRIFRQAAITIATLLTVSAASYASYVAITGNSVLKKSTVQLEGENTEIDTIEFNDVENNGVTYTIECPSDIVMKKDGNTDIYKEKDSYEGEDRNNTDVEIPEVYMKVTITDTETIKKESVNLKEQLNKYKNYSSVKENVKIGNNKYNATKYSIVKGTKWNSEVKDVYIININKSKDMMVEISYFVEASEGWGAKFNQLVIKTLEINQN